MSASGSRLHDSRTDFSVNALTTFAGVPGIPACSGGITGWLGWQRLFLGDRRIAGPELSVDFRTHLVNRTEAHAAALDPARSNGLDAARLIMIEQAAAKYLRS